MRPTTLLLVSCVLVCACPKPEPEQPDGPVVIASASTSAAPDPVPTAAAVSPSPAVRAIVDAPDRTPDDRALDAGRRPAELLAYFGVAPGMRVAELGAGSGYTAELLARAVAPSGSVFAQNNRFVLERFAETPWSERLARPAMKNVVRVDREFDDPLPAEAKDLDAVFMVLFYHDTAWLEVDRDKMNRAVFAALKPGGTYAVVDHSGRAGTGTSEVKTLHRIEEQVVRDEIQRAGFRLVEQAGFLRNPADTRDWNDSPSAAGDKRGKSDRFVLKFVKP